MDSCRSVASLASVVELNDPFRPQKLFQENDLFIAGLDDGTIGLLYETGDAPPTSASALPASAWSGSARTGIGPGAECQVVVRVAKESRPAGLWKPVCLVERI